MTSSPCKQQCRGLSLRVDKGEGEHVGPVCSAPSPALCIVDSTWGSASRQPRHGWGDELSHLGPRSQGSVSSRRARALGVLGERGSSQLAAWRTRHSEWVNRAPLARTGSGERVQTRAEESGI